MLEIHHITHIDNLENIIKNGLLPRNILRPDEYINTANPDIISKRSELNSYVPFHLNLLQIRHGIYYNKDVYKRSGKENIIILSIEYKKYEEDLHKLFVCHPISAWGFEVKELEIYRSKLNSYYKSLPYNDFGPDYKNKEVQNFFMSEVLIKNMVPFNVIDRIFVYDEESKLKVEEILKNCRIEKTVKVNPEFYR